MTRATSAAGPLDFGTTSSAPWIWRASFWFDTVSRVHSTMGMSTHSIVALIMLTRSLPPKSPPRPSSRTITSGFSSAMAEIAAWPSSKVRTGTWARRSSAAAASRVSGSSSTRTTVLRSPSRIGEKPGASPPAGSAASASLAPVGSDTTRRRKGETKAAAKAETEATLDLVLRELRALRETQELILQAIDGLRRAPSSAAPASGTDVEGFVSGDEPGFSPIRDGRRKTVVLVDDDPTTREAAAAELRRAEVPVRTFDDGRAAISAIAEEKPDVIVLELGLGGEMGGKDLVNMVKATMEWVDIPIVLWTREAVSNQKEARQLHGADEVVQKSGGPAALVARVITVFRR